MPQPEDDEGLVGPEIPAEVIAAALDAWDALAEELEAGKGPLFYVLRRFRRDSIEALRALIDVDADDAKEIRRLQSKVAMYGMTITATRGIIADGRVAHSDLTPDEVAEVRRLYDPNYHEVID